MKKPAKGDDKWWRDSKRREGNHAYGLVNKNEGIQAKDAPDGELDDRTTSRAQRDVWKKKMYLASKEDHDRYLFLKSPDCTERGKEQPAHRIINAYVPRDASWTCDTLKPKDMTIYNMRATMTRDDVEVSVRGMKKATFIGRNFAGSKDLFDEAEAEGEIYQDEDGLWYTFQKKHSRGVRAEDRTKFLEQAKVDDSSTS